MKYLPLLLVLFLVGCAPVKNFDKLMTLKAVTDEQKKIGDYVEQQDKLFEQLVELIKSNEVPDDLNQDFFLTYFGEPLYQSKERIDGSSVERWIYRKQMEVERSDRVVLFFNSDKSLRSYQYTPYQEI